MTIKGRAIRYGDNVDTDVIIPARYLNTSDPKELAAHCMEDIDPDFLKKIKPGDIIAAGSNFGCGSSREHAPIAIKNAGIACVVARSFARIFYRNAVNTGLPIVETGAEIDTGDELEIDLAAGTLKNLTKGTEASFPPFPDFLQNIIDAGGLLEAMKKM
ncbi:MAG TPA: 3-isopropylmalate dehydratase small subunit [Clostridiales bacterium]|nr:MAG: 2,3-dimethylmalate dehydratase small subunit [Firmicutes bacterium ADurb.Bin262]HOU10771.1 3-isopropylmalate dehydratase small subunit [Clostridiales bacterium]HQH64256.1 3-isopropylmalate dehydratase small subunit [Clostridiales bacterium]HQK74293.1 3-isopropylmalate dehydratase small subunit [Clostridiales bacterium]